MSDRHQEQLADIMAAKDLSQPQKHIMMAMVGLDQMRTTPEEFADKLVEGTGIDSADVVSELQRLDSTGHIKLYWFAEIK